MTTLRSKLIRLAHSNPEIRAEILPLIWETQEAGEPKAAARGFFPRDSYLPKDNPTLKQIPDMPEGLSIWSWETTGSKGVPILSAAAWTGKADKPLWHYTFRDPSQLDRTIAETKQNYEAVQSVKKKKQDDRKNFTHELQVGDILYSSWGYEQTNIDWFQVTKVVGKQVVIREIAGKTVKEEQGSDFVVPIANHFVGPEMKKTPSGGDYGSGKFVSVRLNTYSSASKWDGKPKRQTSSGYGH